MIITKELALRLKALGFNVKCTHAYTDNWNDGQTPIMGAEPYEFNNSSQKYLSAPTLHEVCDWIRLKGIHICVDAFNGRLTDTYWAYSITNLSVLGPSKDYSMEDAEFESHDEALCAGIEDAIKILEDKKK